MTLRSNRMVPVGSRKVMFNDGFVLALQWKKYERRWGY